MCARSAAELLEYAWASPSTRDHNGVSRNAPSGLFYLFFSYCFALAERRSDGSGMSAAGGERRDGPRNKSRSPAREDLPPAPLTGAFQATRAPRRCTPVPLLSSKKKISSALSRNFQVDRQCASSGRQQHHSECVCVNWEVEGSRGEGRLSHGGAERKYVIRNGPSVL